MKPSEAWLSRKPPSKGQPCNGLVRLRRPARSRFSSWPRHRPKRSAVVSHGPVVRTGMVRTGLPRRQDAGAGLRRPIARRGGSSAEGAHSGFG